MAWYQLGLVVAERRAGGSFDIPRAISGLGGFPAIANLRAPVVSVAADGRAVAAWRRQIDGACPFPRQAIVRPAGQGSGRDGDPLPRPPRAAWVGTVARRRRRGHAIVAWSQPVGASRSAIRARSLARRAAGFGALESREHALGTRNAPSVGLPRRRGEGAVLAWREDPIRGSGRFFRAAIRFSPGAGGGSGLPRAARRAASAARAAMSIRVTTARTTRPHAERDAGDDREECQEHAGPVPQHGRDRAAPEGEHGPDHRRGVPAMQAIRRWTTSAPGRTTRAARRRPVTPPPPPAPAG